MLTLVLPLTLGADASTEEKWLKAEFFVHVCVWLIGWLVLFFFSFIFLNGLSVSFVCAGCSLLLNSDSQRWLFKTQRLSCKAPALPISVKWNRILFCFQQCQLGSWAIQILFREAGTGSCNWALSQAPPNIGGRLRGSGLSLWATDYPVLRLL